MSFVFWFSRLQPGVSPEEYTAFVQQVDYPATRRIGSILNYESIRIHGPATGAAKLPYHFIDLAEVTDVEAYREDLANHPAVQEVHGQFERYVESLGNFWATPLGSGVSRKSS